MTNLLSLSLIKKANNCTKKKYAASENFFCQLWQAAIGKKKIFNPEEGNLAVLKRQGKCDRDDADVDDMIMNVLFLPPHCCLFLCYNLRLQEAKSET
jgi:hypothetical protein